MVSTQTKPQSDDQNSPKNSPKDSAKSFNLNVNPTGAGIFGFGNFAETWNGRMAMMAW